MSRNGVMNKTEVKALFKRTAKMHAVWHKFCAFLTEKLGSDWQNNLVGYEVMELIEGYAKKNKSIKISYCDDDHFCSSMIVIVPHKNMGNTVLFIPQCCNITNTFFLYPGHQKMLIEKLNELTHTDPMEKYLKRIKKQKSKAKI